MITIFYKVYSMKIMKLSGTIIYHYELMVFIHKHGLLEGSKIGISLKVGKRRKLRAYTISRLSSWKCDTCGHVTEVDLRKGTEIFKLDNHLGRSWVVLL